MAKQVISEFVRTHKALSHPGRLRILAMLRGGPLCVCQMTAVLKLAPSTVSAHLSELRRANLVTERKEGRWVEYRLTDDVDGAQASVGWERLGRDPTVVQDRALLRVLRKVPLEELCRVELDLSKVGIRLPALAVGGRSRQLR
jgi:DNA-binding transcriptional ArsR family regulator